MTLLATPPSFAADAARGSLDAVVEVVAQVRGVLDELPGGDLTPAYGAVDGAALDDLVGEVAAAVSQGMRFQSPNSSTPIAASTARSPKVIV